jgi:MFS family permease
MSVTELVAVAPPRVIAPTAAGLQRRTLTTLITTQIAGGAGLASAVTVGALIAADLAGPGAAGLPLAASVGGTATAALPLASVMRHRGRRRGLRVGWLTGAIGATLVVGATVASSLPLLLIGMFMFGGADASSAAARFAAADLALPDRRGAAIGLVVASTGVTATLGPTLTARAAAMAGTVGLPSLAGPFVLSATAFLGAGAVLSAFLRPDPLLVANAMASQPQAPTATVTPLRELVRRRGVVVGMAAAMIANFVMWLLMTVTPLHVTAGHAEHGAGLRIVGLIIAVHVGGMFAPAPVTGWIGDRVGHRLVVAAGAVLLVVAGLLSCIAGPHDTVLLLVAMLKLGVGFSLAFVSGSALLTAAVDPLDRPRVQGATDMAMGVAGMLGAGLSGVVMANGGMAAVGVVGAVTALPLAVAMLWRHGRDRAWALRQRRVT